MKKNFFYQALMRDPTADWAKCREFNNNYMLYHYHICAWSFGEWHTLFSKHPCTMFTHGGFLFPSMSSKTFSIVALRHFRKSEDLFVFWCSSRSLSDEQWDQICSRIPKYAHYRLIFT